MPVNYQLGKIYKIECFNTGKVYIGSTAQPTLAKRLGDHTNNYKCWLNEKTPYVSSYEILKEGNFEIILIELYPCDSKDELHARERYWTKQMDCVNRIKNQGLINQIGKQQYDKQYAEEHRAMLTEKQRHYRQQYTDQRKEAIAEKQKQYQENNKETISKQRKQYRENNKEQLRQKYTCDCGGCYTHTSKTTHMKTKKHQQYLEEQTKKENNDIV